MTGRLPAQSKQGDPTIQAPGWGDYWTSPRSIPPEYTKWRADYSEALRRKDYAKAVAVSDKLIARNPNIPLVYVFRGAANEALGRDESARRDLEHALTMYKSTPAAQDILSLALRKLAIVSLRLGRTAEAQGYLRRAAKEAPNDPKPYNAMAWVMATSPNAAVRNGKEAVQLATKACTLSSWKNASYIDTLAAACAETADFTSAIKWQTNAIELAKRANTKLDQPEKRLALYRIGQPYRAEK